ncbi:FCD domain-containing protein [Streptomyces sp. NPDC102384]|uniref:FCD domain-containing protein n=1 Tax=Streptomyces sp. NPDC102384 TaxID=3366166 RepID=UPI003812FEB0
MFKPRAAAASLRLGCYPATTLAVTGRWDEAIAEHRAIIEAIAERDAERAGKLSGEHMARARELRLQIYAEDMPD